MGNDDTLGRAERVIGTSRIIGLGWCKTWGAPRIGWVLIIFLENLSLSDFGLELILVYLGELIAEIRNNSIPFDAEKYARYRNTRTIP